MTKKEKTIVSNLMFKMCCLGECRDGNPYSHDAIKDVLALLNNADRRRLSKSDRWTDDMWKEYVNPEIKK